MIPQGEEQLALETLMQQVRLGKIGRDAAAIIAAGICGDI